VIKVNLSLCPSVRRGNAELVHFNKQMLIHELIGGSLA
jgi:hypothetical protein